MKPLQSSEALFYFIKTKKRNAQPQDDSIINAKRARTKTKRFGHRESTVNYNDFFENLSDSTATKEANSSPLHTNINSSDVVVVNDSTLSDHPLNSQSPSNKSIENQTLDVLKLILKKVNAIEDHLIKLDVRVANLKSVRGQMDDSDSLNVPLGVIDMFELQQLGLPVQSEQDLQKLEGNLKTDQAFSTKLVC